HEPPLGHRLAAGDRLTAVAALPDLERLFRRERRPAEWAVEVTGFPPAAREPLTLLVQAKQGLAAESAGPVLERLPFVLEGGLTRGQGEDVLALLGRDQIGGRLVKAGTVSPAGERREARAGAPASLRPPAGETENR